MPRPGLTAVEIVHVYAEYHGGAPMYQLARDYGVSAEHVRKTLLECGAAMRPKGYRSAKAAT